MGCKGVEAGQVYKLRGLAGGKFRAALFLFNGDAGIIRDLLPKAGERVKKRRLSASGVPGERNRDFGWKDFNVGGFAAGWHVCQWSVVRCQ